MEWIRKTTGGLLLCLLFACGKADRVPSGVMEKDKMRDVLLDMNYADVYSREMMQDTIRLSDSAREQNLKRMYAQILQLHGITREEFSRSYKFYESHPDRLQQIYADMEQIVSRKRQVVDSLEQLRFRRKGPDSFDSLYRPRRDSAKLYVPFGGKRRPVFEKSKY